MKRDSIQYLFWAALFGMWGWVGWDNGDYLMLSMSAGVGVFALWMAWRNEFGV